MTEPGAAPQPPDEPTPETVDNAFAYAVALVESGRLSESGAYFRKALEEAPKDGQRWYAFGSALGQAGRLEDAEKALWNALRLGYQEAPVFDTLGVIYVRMRLLAEAEQAYREVAKRDPNSPSAWIGLGNACFARGDRLNGWRAVEAAVGCKPRQVDEQASQAQSRLWLGHYRLGWREYEARRLMSEWRAANREMPQLGKPLDRRKIRLGVPVIVASEQGQGDAIQFARFLLPFAERFGVPIWFRCHDSLRECFEGTFDGTAVRVLKSGEAITVADAQGWMPLMSMPYFLGLSSPKDVPPPVRPFGMQWARNERSHTPRCFVHNQGNKGHAYDWDRSAPAGVMQEAAARAGYEVVTARDGATWRDTVDDLMGCDRVLTVDTGLAHVAASLGVPTDICVPTLPEWRWGCGQRSKSDWYPSATLWHRGESKAWPELLERWVAERSVVNRAA